jgi:hypothetical protein
MRAGIYHAVLGGIERIARELTAHSPVPPRVLVTGGDGPFLFEGLRTTPAATLRPWLTLEGILASAEALTP